VKASSIRERVANGTLQRASLRLFSTAMGWGARRQLPAPLRRPLYGAFASWVGARVDEAELPLEDYPTFASFFARRLRPGARSFSVDGTILVAPCDGVLTSCEPIARGRVVQAKGHDYGLAEFLADEELAEALDGGVSLTFYLSPRDYHRVHAPVTGRLRGYSYIPGSLLPVSARFREHVDDLFVHNERLVLPLDTPIGTVAMVMVGAAGVGNMCLYQQSFENRALRSSPGKVVFDSAIALERGDEVAGFELGSTVVLMLAPDTVELSIDCGDSGVAVECGHALGKLSAEQSANGMSR
jgi:phosphatidylserine decarboxylase